MVSFSNVAYERAPRLQHRHFAAAGAFSCGTCGWRFPGATRRFAVLQEDAGASPQFSGLPQFTADLGRAASGAKDQDGPTYGDQYIAQHGVNNRPGEKDACGYIIATGAQDKLAWAQYDVGVFKSKRPTRIGINVGNVIAPGANDDLPLIFWVGVSDYTSGTWQMIGPFTKSADIVVNSDDWRHRCVGKSNNMYILILTDSSGVVPSPNNPDGIAAVEIESLTVKANSSYKPTAPIIPYDLVLNYDAALGTVVLTWTHLTDTSSSQNEALTYTVERVQVSDGTAIVIGTTTAPAATFNDPADVISGTPAQVPGEVYRYYVRAANDLETPYVLIGEVTAQ